MSFNTAKTGQQTFSTHEGGRGYLASPEWQLFLLVAGSLFAGDTFYEGEEGRKQRLAFLAKEVTARDPELVAGLAVFARQVLGLRSGPSALVAHLFWEGPRPLALAAASGVWLRGDEHLETLAYTRAQGWKLRKSLKKAVAERLNRMSPRALIKYAANNRLFSQRDALILSHPKAADREHALVYDYLVRGKRASPEALAFVARLLEEKPSWEHVVSQKGSTPAVWRSMVPHLEGLALVRNLGNLARHDLLSDPEVQAILLEKLSQPERVKAWGIPPHGWLLALEEVGDSMPPRLREAVVGAVESLVPRLPLQGETLVLVDVSGSMFSPLSRWSQATYALAAAGLGALLVKATGGQLFGFSDELIRLELGSEASVVEMVEALLDRGMGGTQLGRALREALRLFWGKRVVIFTDEQVADDAYTPLRRWLKEEPGRKAYVVNVAGYEPLAFPHGGVVRIGGFSDKLLELLPVLESTDPLEWIRRMAREGVVA
ncbi:MAG: TROVE domain-containing protein [Thermus sp.]|nr:TROVE domain-containing protein [Thermus sp.]